MDPEHPSPAGSRGQTPRAAAGEAATSDAGRDSEADQAPGGAAIRPRKRTLSSILTEIGQDTSRTDVTVDDLIAILGGRGRAGLMLLFALPNVLPAPPGLSGVLGLPLLYLSVQLMLGRVPWLPGFIGDRSMPRDRFAQLVARLGPWLARAERLLRPRWSLLVSHGAERVLGAICLVLAAVLALPIPFGNMLPAFAICLIALGILERDGVWVAAGTVVGAGALLLVAGIVYALVKSAIFILVNAFA
jgi:hypothetical protein